jgi:hypothetical protein
MYTIAVAALSLAMIAAFVLTGGGAYLLIKGEHRKQGVLMVLAAAVLFANVLTWTL